MKSFRFAAAAASLALLVLVASPDSARSRLSSVASRRHHRVLQADCFFCKGGPRNGDPCNADLDDCGSGQGCKLGTCDVVATDPPTTSPTPDTGGGGDGVCPDGTTACSSSADCPGVCDKGDKLGQECADRADCGGRGAKCVPGGCTVPPMDPCAPDPCGNGGTCSVDGDSYACDCPAGFYFTGTSCRDDPCVPNPCVADAGETDGTCSRDNASYVCDCSGVADEDVFPDCRLSTFGILDLDETNDPPKCYGTQDECALCEGDCDYDEDCADGLVCFIRDSSTTSSDDPIPGCLGNVPALDAKDFCVEEALFQCGDSDYIIVDGKEQDCTWVTQDTGCPGEFNGYCRCVAYNGYCRETCGKCKVSRTTSLFSLASDQTWDDNDDD